MLTFYMASQPLCGLQRFSADRANCIPSYHSLQDNLYSLISILLTRINTKGLKPIAIKMVVLNSFLINSGEKVGAA